MQTNSFSDFRRLLSEQRIESYRNTSGTDEDCICRYLWNTALAESLHPVLHILEVTFRNAVHRAIGGVMLASPFKTADWLLASTGLLKEAELDRLEDAKQYLHERRKPITEAYLVAELSFGFWNSLLNARYDMIWPKIIKDVVPNMPKTIRLRTELSARMSKLRHLRNAAYHHHSLWHWHDLAQQHADARTMVEWIGSAGGAMTNVLDRFPQVHAAGPDAYRQAVQGF